MTIANLGTQALNIYDLMQRIGIHRRRSRALRLASSAGWIGAGMAVGGGLALLLTPRSGSEMRERLGERAKRARDYLMANGREPASDEPTAQEHRATSPGPSTN